MTGIVPPIGEIVPGLSFLIWSNSGGGFCNAAKTGYTKIIERAARFTATEAAAYCNDKNAKPPTHGKFNALPVPDPCLAPVVRPWLA